MAAVAPPTGTVLVITPHGGWHRGEPILNPGTTDQLPIASLDPTEYGESGVFNSEDHCQPDAVPLQGTEPSCVLISTAAEAQTNLEDGADTTSSLLNSGILTSFELLSSPSRTLITVDIPPNSTSSTSSSIALASPAPPDPTYISTQHFSALFYFAIIFGVVGILVCCLVFLARRIRARAVKRHVGGNNQRPITRDLLGDEPSLQVRRPSEESELSLPAPIPTRHDISGRSTPSVPDTPQTLGRLRVANIASGDLTSGDEASVIHRTTTYQNSMAGEVGTPRSTVQDSRQSPTSLGGQFIQSSPALHHTPGTNPRDHQQEPMGVVPEGRPQETQAIVLRCSPITANSGRQFSSEESIVPLVSAEHHRLPPSLPDLHASSAPLTADVKPELSNRNNKTRSSGESGDDELGGSPRDVSQSSVVLSDSQGTGVPSLRTQQPRAPPEPAAVDSIGSLSPAKSRISWTGPFSNGSSELEAAAKIGMKNRPESDRSTQLCQPSTSTDDVSKPRGTAQPGRSGGPARKKGGQRKSLIPRLIQRESSVSSMMSGSSHSSRPGDMASMGRGKNALV